MDRVDSPKALKWLIDEATRNRPKPNPDQALIDAGGSDASSESEWRVELINQSQTMIAGRDDHFGLASSLLSYVTNQLRTQAQLRGMLATLSPPPRLPSSPSIRLLALCQITRSGFEVIETNAPTVIAYSEVLESLVSSPYSCNASVYTSLRKQFSKWIETPELWLSELLPLYAASLVSESRRSKGDIVALDLFSDTLEILRRYSKECDTGATKDAVYQLLCKSIERNIDAGECLDAFVTLQSRDSASPQRTPMPTETCLDFLTQLLSQIEPDSRALPTIASWVSRLAWRDSTGMACELFMKWCLNSTGNQPGFLGNLGRALENAVESKVELHRLKYLLSVVERGELTNSNDLLLALSKMTDSQQLESLASHRVLTSSALAGVDRLRAPEVSELVSPELLRVRLSHWQELNDIHRGFTSRLISTKRGPFREPPDLVQFAVDVGSEDSVKYFNAKDPNRFPGKGFFITRLRLSKCFAPESSIDPRHRVDPYRIYKQAWPALADAIDHFDDAEFLFLRGCIIISCKHRDYLLPSGNGEHFSLIVFNDHFRNPFQEVAYLVPNQGIAKLLAKTQIPYSDFIGFDPRRPDINDQLQSPQHLLEHPFLKDRAIDVGGVSAILSGFGVHLHRVAAMATPNSLNTSLSALSQKTEEHNRQISEWERRNHRYHLSQAGQQRMTELSDAGRRLQYEANAIRNRQSQILAQIEESIWHLVDKYTSLHKLLCIAHAYWHRGYTAGKTIATHHIDESIQQEQIWDATPDQGELRMEKGSNAIVNRNSIRMLVQAYEWHAMRENPASRREDFPVLVVCDATQIGAQPTLDIYVDTFDMTANVDGQRVEFTKGRMTSEDELYWMTSIFPRVQDETGKIRDLRFYPRASLSIV